MLQGAEPPQQSIFFNLKTSLTSKNWFFLQKHVSEKYGSTIHWEMGELILHCMTITHSFIATPWSENLQDKALMDNPPKIGNDWNQPDKQNCRSSILSASQNCLGNTPAKPNNSWIPNSHTLSCSSYFIYKRRRKSLLLCTSSRIIYLGWKDLYRIGPTAQTICQISVFNYKCHKTYKTIKLI